MALGYVDLTGRVALVTGARRGIGRAIARRLAAHGAAVVLAAKDHREERVGETLAWFASAGFPYRFLEFDLADAGARANAVERAGTFFGPVDILVNNASVGHGVAPSQIDLSLRREMLEVNFQGPVDLIQQALPAMCAKRWGRIVNILSDTMHQQPIPYSTPEADVHGLTTYGASKAALERFTLGLAAELHGTGVHVNATYPYKICVTEQSSERALAGLRARPDYAESLEMMAEAAYLLIAGELTGVSDSSRRLMQMLQQPLHALDGRTVIGDAWTVPELTGSPS